MMNEQLLNNEVIEFKAFPIFTPTRFSKWLAMIVIVVALSLIAGMSGIADNPGRIGTGVYDWENVAILFPIVALIVILANLKGKFVWGLRVKLDKDSMLIPKELLSATQDKKIKFKEITQMFVRRAQFGIKAQSVRYIYTKLVLTLNTGEKIAIPRVNMPIMAELTDYIVEKHQTPVRFGSMLIAMVFGWIFSLVFVTVLGYKISQMS